MGDSYLILRCAVFERNRRFYEKLLLPEICQIEAQGILGVHLHFASELRAKSKMWMGLQARLSSCFQSSRNTRFESEAEYESQATSPDYRGRYFVGGTRRHLK